MILLDDNSSGSLVAISVEINLISFAEMLQSIVGTLFEIIAISVPKYSFGSHIKSNVLTLIPYRSTPKNRHPKTQMHRKIQSLNQGIVHENVLFTEACNKKHVNFEKKKVLKGLE